MSEKKVVFINQATGYLTIDIVNAFVPYCNRVAVISWDIREQDVPLHPSVEWSKINRYRREKATTKFSSWFMGTLRIFWLLLTKYRRYEIFYITVPPMAYLLSLVLPQKFSILVFDLYPDVLKIYKIGEGNPVYRFWAWCNRRLFKKAHRLYTLSGGMARLMEQYIPADKVEVIPNWTGLTNIREIEKKDNFFIEEQGLSGKFIVQYSGNIGVTHNVEVLVQVADLLRHRTDIFFLIIGRGNKYRDIEQLISEKKLENCRILPYQPDNILNYTLAASDLSVVVLDDISAQVSVPSKIYNIQAVGAPILGIASVNSELARHLQKYQNGVCFPASDPERIAAYIEGLFAAPDTLQALQQNARLASKDFTMANADNYRKSYFSA